MQYTKDNQHYAYNYTLYRSVELLEQVQVTYSLKSLLNYIYPLIKIQHVNKRTTFFYSQAILYSRNNSATAINNTILKCLGGLDAEEQAYESVDRVKDNSKGLGKELPPTYLVLLLLLGLLLASLQLQKGAPIILLQNLFT